jgi:hypothetical protein
VILELQAAIVAIAAAPHVIGCTDGGKWGDPISEERQAELQGYLDCWAAVEDHGEQETAADQVDATAA